jgi:hypothetical protein
VGKSLVLIKQAVATLSANRNSEPDRKLKVFKVPLGKRGI